ncbi:hypothetical protein BJ508DRAFT_379954 [Ascobolus immersus RN42]|uniref:Uncharacterized protein n=1 Tax=Ascobolus immersus RN42 TaxID=1160509 RepID=A0A3N4HP92_ASCIM|nr:hypothetical protein BJ508DRAFT_379954 [Ascobolus immersus RN42]
MRFSATALLLATATLAQAGTQLKAWYGDNCDPRFGTMCSYDNIDTTKDFDVCCGVGNYNWKSFELVTDLQDAILTAYTGEGQCKTGPKVSVGPGECRNVDSGSTEWNGGVTHLSLHVPRKNTGASASRRRRSERKCQKADSEVLMVPHEDGEGVVYREIPVGKEVEVERAILRRDFVFLRALPVADVHA